MVGIAKEKLGNVLHAAGLRNNFWTYAAMYITDVMRHNSTGRPWTQPAFGEGVAATRPRPKKA
eukprot:12922887-Prorocentrum_lima.AAC.1